MRIPSGRWGSRLTEGSHFFHESRNRKPLRAVLRALSAADTGGRPFLFGKRAKPVQTPGGKRFLAACFIFIVSGQQEGNIQPLRTVGAAVAAARARDRIKTVQQITHLPDQRQLFFRKRRGFGKGAEIVLCLLQG